MNNAQKQEAVRHFLAKFKDIEFSDAQMAELFSSEVLAGRFAWTKELGWLKWDERRWQEVPEPVILGVVRKWILDRYVEAGKAVAMAAECVGKNVSGQCKYIQDDLFRYQSAGHLSALCRLAKPDTVQKVRDFDSHPDLLNVRNGIINLETGELLPHDPSYLLTKLAPVDYEPGARHPDWDAALDAIPEDVREWFQIRMGQGITGYIPDDDIMIVMQGGGENGKNTLMEAVAKTLGEYHLLVDHRALLGNLDQHPTELAEFRGAHLAWLDELPEGRYLPTVRLKRLTSGQISARRMAKDTMVFDCSHSLFVSTNYLPTVSETDTGTWRRLALLRFPYRYRKPGQPIKRDYERRGDPNLRQRLRRGNAQHEAILAWLVEGAMKWYKLGMQMPPLPDHINRDTEAWRMESDSILCFLREEMEFDLYSHIMSTDLFREFNDWLATRQQRAWTDKTFFDRFGNHEEVAAHSVERRKLRSTKPGLSRPVAPQGHVPSSFQAWIGLCFRGQRRSCSGCSGSAGRSQYASHP